MLYFILILAIIGIIIYFAIIGLSQLFSLYYGSPFIKTPPNIQNEIAKLAKLKPKETFYDLGCGSGEILRFIAKDSKIKVIGVEASPILYIYTKLLTKTYPNIKIVLENLMKIDLSNANVIYCYLYPKMMAKLQTKFLHELKNGSRVISFQFPLPDIKPAKIKQINKQKLYLYKF